MNDCMIKFQECNKIAGKEPTIHFTYNGMTYPKVLRLLIFDFFLVIQYFPFFPITFNQCDSQQLVLEMSS